MLSITTAQAEKILLNLIPRKAIPLFAGPPGCGKTALFLQACQALEYRCYVFHPVTDDPTNYKGFPWVSRETGKAEFIPYGEFAALLEATEPTLAFFDDLGHAPRAVQATLMQPFHTRTLNGLKIPDCVSFGAATNRRTDKAGVEGLIDPLVSRCRVFDLRPDLESFAAYWMRTNKRPEVMAYLRFRPDHLYLQKKTSDIENFPCSRTWEYVSQDLEAGIGNGLELPIFAADVGEGVAGEFCTFLRLFREMPDPDNDLKYPDKAKVPENLSVLHAWCTALAYRCTSDTFPAIAQIINRLMKAGREEMAVVLLADCGLRCPTIQQLSECTALAKGKLGKLILPAT